MQKGSYRSAIQLLRRSMIFPGIVSKICPGDCMKNCVRGQRTGDRSVDLKALEQSCIEHTAKQKPARYTVLKKPQKAAVIGAGLSGLACAYRMASYGYSVTVYEMARSIGGSVLSELDPEVCRAEFEKAFGVVDCEFVMGTRVTNLAEIQADAIYIATGKDGDDFGHCVAGEKEPDSGRCTAGEGGDDLGHLAAEEKEPDSGHCAAEEGGDDFEYCGGQELEETAAMKRSDFCGARNGGLVCGNSPGIFLGGRLTGADLTESLAQGLKAAAAMETYFKTGKMELPSSPQRRVPDERYYNLHYDFEKQDNAKIKGEAEAGRCLRCNCSECYDVCAMMEKERRFPRQICGDVVVTLKPNMCQRTGVRIIAGCTFCGKCKEACPEHIDMAECLENARSDFYESGAMAPAFHGFWLQDMEFSRSEEAGLIWRPDKNKDCGTVFFPGCQLGASQPELVTLGYEEIRRHDSNAAIWLGCCGVPARWAGMKAEAEKIAAEIQSEWEKLGRPLVVTACPSCLKNLGVMNLEMKVQSVYEYLTGQGGVRRRTAGNESSEAEKPGRENSGKDGERGSFGNCGENSERESTEHLIEKAMEQKNPGNAGANAAEKRGSCDIAGKTMEKGKPGDAGESTAEKGAPAAGIGRKTEENRKTGRTRIRVLDPCAAAGNDGMANAVRQLLRDAGYSLLDGNEQPDPACCGFGGHIYPAAPAVCDTFAKRRVEGETEICGVYCANCRDAYVHSGADARHVLELILGETKRCAALPELDERRENRRRLRRIFTGQPEPKEETGMKIEIPVQLIDKMDRELILREQVHAVIEEAEETGRKVYDPEQDIYYAHQRFGHATVWAGYQAAEGGILVTSVYCHRVEVEESL